MPFRAEERHVLKLEKSLYGLKTSLKRWCEIFMEVLLKLGSVADSTDPYLFVCI